MLISGVVQGEVYAHHQLLMVGAKRHFRAAAIWTDMSIGFWSTDILGKWADAQWKVH